MPDDIGSMPDILARICSDKRAEVAVEKSRRGIDALRQEISGRVGPTRGFGFALKEAAAAGHCADHRNQEGLAVQWSDPARFRPGRSGQGLSGRRRRLSFGADRAAALHGRAEPFEGGTGGGLPAGAAQGFHRRSLAGVTESRAMGADCILLIMAAVTDAQARELEQLAISLDLDVLVEVHDHDELDRALLLETSLIGINNRNLKTLETDLTTTVALGPLVPPDRFLIAESGIRDTADLRRSVGRRSAGLSRRGELDAADGRRPGGAGVAGRQQPFAPVNQRSKFRFTPDLSGPAD